MLNFSKKYWIVIFFVIFLVGFAVGYVTMTFDFYNQLGNNRSFLQILSPI